MALQDNAFVTLALAKTYLKIPTGDTAQDSIVELFINAASDYLEGECDRVLKKRTITETRHGRGQNILMLKEFPIISVTSLKVDPTSTFTDPSTVIPTTDYRIGDDKNTIVLLNRTFAKAYNNIQVVYEAGYENMPSDLQHAALWLCYWYHAARKADDIGRPRRSKGDESFEISQSAPKEVRDTIARYKRTEVPNLEAPIRNI